MNALRQLVFLIRHAEEPAPGSAGVDRAGNQDVQSLSVRGWQRAGALVTLFAPALQRPVGYGIERPSSIFAACDAGKSHRPVDTVADLAKALSIPVDVRYGSTQKPQELVAAALRAPGPVLIVWRHAELPTLARAFAPELEVDIPEAWGERNFDAVWRLERTAGRWNFRELFQGLLPEDRGR